MVYDKNSEQSSQSAKDILEDIKKVMYNKSKSFTTDEKLDNEEDIPYLQAENDEHLSFEDKKDIFEDIDKTSNGVFNHATEPVLDVSKVDTNNNKQSSLDADSTSKQKVDDSLLSKNNIDASYAEIQHLVEEVYKSRRSSNGYNLTLEELAINLLKPELSKWLNSNLHNLVKEIVEKEIKHITGGK